MTQKIAGILFIVAGAVSFIYFLVTSILGIFAGLQRIEAPGARDLELEAGAYTVSWEINATFDKPMGKPDGLRVSVSRDGVELPLEAAGLLKSRYSTGTVAGVSIYDLQVPAKATYTVSAAGTSLPSGRVVVGPSVGVFGVVKIVLGCLAILGIGAGGGVFLIVRSLKEPTPPPPSP